MLLRGELKATEERLAIYEAVHEASKNTPGKVKDELAAFLSLLTLEYDYRYSQAGAQWLRSAIERVETKNFSIDIQEEK